MSSLTVLCPNGHRVKVSTTPNMSLQAVLDTACQKKGLDSARHALQRNNKKVDTSSTIRFSGIPNNANLEMVELSEEELSGPAAKQEVSVCLQTPSGERLVETFPSSASLGLVVGRWADKLGEASVGEEPVIVYMRREVVGQEELNTTTLKTLGLTQGKGLFRFFYKKPEVLKCQANVYDIKLDKPSPPPELPHIPMRLEPEPVKVPSQAEQREDNELPSPAMDPCNDNTANLFSVKSDSQDVKQPSFPDTSQDSVEDAPPALPDSTQSTREAVINPVGPHQAIAFSVMEESAQYQELDDEFFDLSLDEVKTLYRDLKQEVKKVSDGDMLMTKEMRVAQQEGEKLSLLSKYKTGVLRVMFPSRHVVQGQFPAHTTIKDVITWLSPLLSSPPSTCELYTAPPRTTLPYTSTLLDLGLFPAALVHFSSGVTKSGPVQYLSDETLASLSNSEGANIVASRARREGARGGKEPPRLGSCDTSAVQQSRSLDPGAPGPSSTLGGGGHKGEGGQPAPGKVPKWFKTGK